MQQNQYHKAREHFLLAIANCQATTNDPNTLIKLHESAGRAAENLGKYEGAISSYTLALAYDGKNIKLLERRAIAAEKGKNLSMAFDDISKICALQNFKDSKYVTLAIQLAERVAIVEAANIHEVRYYCFKYCKTQTVIFSIIKPVSYQCGFTLHTYLHTSTS